MEGEKVVYTWGNCSVGDIGGSLTDSCTVKKSRSCTVVMLGRDVRSTLKSSASFFPSLSVSSSENWGRGEEYNVLAGGSVE